MPRRPFTAGRRDSASRRRPDRRGPGPRRVQQLRRRRRRQRRPTDTAAESTQRDRHHRLQRLARAGSRSPSPRSRASSTEVGLDVELEYFADYTASLDALVAGQVDVNAQTLNDTIFAVSSGRRPEDRRRQRQLDRQRRHHLRRVDHDASRTWRARPSPPRPGVVDHFLLLQGLADRGHDRGRHRLPGRQDRRRGGGVRRRRSSTASACSPRSPSRRSSGRARKVLFTLGRLPRRDPRPPRRHGGVRRRAPRAGAEARRRLVRDARLHRGRTPTRRTRSWPRRPSSAPRSTRTWPRARRSSAPTRRVNAFEDRPDDPTSLPEMARRINPFLVESGLAEEEADLDRALRAGVHPDVRRREVGGDHRPRGAWRP